MATIYGLDWPLILIERNKTKSFQCYTQLHQVVKFRVAL